MLFRHEKIAFTDYAASSKQIRVDEFRQETAAGVTFTVSYAMNCLLKHLNYFNIN